MLISNVSAKKIPTNVITGFLGVGKTSAILNLLANKPNDEKWAVLVNEFGEVGIDGSSFSGSTQDKLHIKEVVGGCMCCASGMSMRVALNSLLSQLKPDRLLIEPSGIGHPEGVIDILCSDDYQHIIELHQTIVIVDARKITDERYNQHPTYLQQLDAADVVVANKADLYETHDTQYLTHFLHERFGATGKPFSLIHNAELPVNLLEEKTTANSSNKLANIPKSSPFTLFKSPITAERNEAVDFPESGFISITNEGNDFFSCGWVFVSDIVFDAIKLHTLLSTKVVERIKGVFITTYGPTLFNIVDGELMQSSLDSASDSRIEIITRSSDIFEQFEADLLRCIELPPVKSGT